MSEELISRDFCSLNSIKKRKSLSPCTQQPKRQKQENLDILQGAQSSYNTSNSGEMRLGDSPAGMCCVETVKLYK